jgi:hypothetical protein
LKKYRGIEENLWSTDKPNVVELVTAEAILEAMAYVMANPTSAGLVDRARKWPGLITRPTLFSGRELPALPPAVYFEKPKTSRLAHTLPAKLLALFDRDDLLESLKARVAELEQQAAADLKAKGRNFIGLERLAKTRFTDRPRRPRRNVEYGYRTPTIKAVVKAELERALDRMERFQRAYRGALLMLREGYPRTFPAGTWWLVTFAGQKAARAD